MQKRSCEPRLSTRTRLALFGERSAELEELEYIRRTAFAEYSRGTAQADFTIELFQPKGLNNSATDIKATRDNFRFFVQQVGIISDGSAQERDAARTMYNIVVRRKDQKDLAYTDAVSYFGKISQAKFDLIRNAALDLYKGAQQAQQSNKPFEKAAEQPAAVEFGFDLEFNPPELVDETAGRDYSVFPSFSSSASSSSSSSGNRDYVNGTALSSNTAAKELLQLCSGYVSTFSFSMPCDRLAEEILKLLHDTTLLEDATQAKLFELVGESGFDFLFAVMQGSDRFRSITGEDLQDETQRQSKSEYLSQAQSASIAQTLSGSSNSNGSNGLFGMMTPAQTAAAFPSLSEDLDSLSLNQRRKREKKEKEKADKEAGSLSAAMQDPSMAWLIEAGFSEVCLLLCEMYGSQ